MRHEIPIDIFNPGEVLACLGFASLADDGLVQFDFSDSPALRSPNARFVLETAADVGKILSSKVEVIEVSIPTALDEELLQPVMLRIGEQELMLDWWMNWCKSGKSPLKFYVGTTTAVGILKAAIDGITGGFSLDAYTETKLAKSVFGFDSRTTIERDTLAVGFSIDEERTPVRIYPWTEILVAVGLQKFRPVMNKAFTYNVWREPLPIEIARIVFGMEIPGVTQLTLTSEILCPDGKLKKVLPARIERGGVKLRSP